MLNETVKIKIRNENDAFEINPDSGEITWQIEEPDHLPKKAEWFWALGILALALIVFSILLKNYLLIIIIALSAFIIYAVKNKKRDFIYFRLDSEGLHIDRKFYSYENFESFFIFPSEREIAFRFKKHLVPLLVIPFHNNDEASIRKVLNMNLEEAEEKESFIDLMRKRLF